MYVLIAGYVRYINADRAPTAAGEGFPPTYVCACMYSIYPGNEVHTCTVHTVPTTCPTPARNSRPQRGGSARYADFLPSTSFVDRGWNHWNNVTACTQVTIINSLKNWGYLNKRMPCRQEQKRQDISKEQYGAKKRNYWIPKQLT